MEQAERLLKYDPVDNHYYTSSDLKIIDYKEATPELYHTYRNGEYDKIFDDYDPETDIVSKDTLEGYEDRLFIQLKRIGAYDGHTTELPSGFYQFEFEYNSAYLASTSVKKDCYIDIDQAASFVVDDMKYFFNRRSEWGSNHRRSVLLYGPPGNGKSMAINHAAHQIVEGHRGCVLRVTEPRFNWVSQYRKVLEDRNCVVIIEEITEYEDSDQAELLDFLDGQLSWEHTYIAATTNYPSELAENLGSRPGRLDAIQPVPNPKAEQRKLFLQRRLGQEPPAAIVQKTEGFSYAYLNELVDRVEHYSANINEAFEQLQQHKQRFEDGFDLEADPDNESVGFDLNENGHEPTAPTPIHSSGDD